MHPESRVTSETHLRDGHFTELTWKTPKKCKKKVDSKKIENKIESSKENVGKGDTKMFTAQGDTTEDFNWIKHNSLLIVIMRLPLKYVIKT